MTKPLSPVDVLSKLAMADSRMIRKYESFRKDYGIVEAFERAMATIALEDLTVGTTFELVRDPMVRGAYAARDEQGNCYMYHGGTQKPTERVEEVEFTTWPPQLMAGL